MMFGIHLRGGIFVTKVKVGDDIVQRSVRCKIRMDFPGMPKSGRFLFGSKGTLEIAEQKRKRQVANWQNVPVQGLSIEHIEEKDIYTIIMKNKNTKWLMPLLS